MSVDLGGTLNWGYLVYENAFDSLALSPDETFLIGAD